MSVKREKGVQEECEEQSGSEGAQDSLLTIHHLLRSRTVPRSLLLLAWQPMGSVTRYFNKRLLGLVTENNGIFICLD